MFYLETKDGDKFFTTKDSEDRLEFEKILEAKLGADAASLFKDLVEDDSEAALHVLSLFSYRYNACIKAFDAALIESPINSVILEAVLADFQQLYLEFMRGT